VGDMPMGNLFGTGGAKKKKLKYERGNVPSGKMNRFKRGKGAPKISTEKKRVRGKIGYWNLW